MEQTETKTQYSRLRVGLMLTAVILLVMITGFSNYKFVPMQGAIMEFFHIEESSYGFLNTALAWTSIALAVPFAFIVRKFRVNISVIFGLIVAIGGIIIQTMAISFIVMIIGRMIEGIGVYMATLVTSSLILTLTNRARASFWSSVMIFATVLPQVIMTKGGTALMVGSGLTFQQVFWIMAIIYTAVIVIWLLLVPFSLRITGVGSGQKATKEQTMRVIKNKSNWLVVIANVFYYGSAMSFPVYIIRFLTMKGMTQPEAANIYSYTTIIGLFSMIAFGFISDKLKTKRKIAIVSYIAGAIALVLLAVLPANLILIYIVLWGTFPRSIAGMTQAAATDVAEIPADIPVVASIKNMVTQIGSIVMGISQGFMVQYLGYQTTIFVLAGGLVVGAVLWFFAKRIP